MNTMKVFLSISALLAWIFGLMLLFAPKDFYAPTGIAMTNLIATIAQAHGATLVGLGFINWFSRNLNGREIRGVLVGNLVIQIISLVVVIRTMSLGAGAAVLPGAIIHVVLGSLFGFFLYKTTKLAGN